MIVRGSLLARACVLFAVSCGCATAPGPSPRETTPAEEVASWRADRDHPLAARMRELARELERAGLSAGPLEGRGFLATNGTTTRPVRIPPGRCTTLIALTSGGLHDLDARLYTPAGDILAEDERSNPRPTVQVCGGETGRRLYYHLEAYEGVGAYLYASFEGQRASFDAVARILGGRPGVAAESRRELTQDAKLRELEEGLKERGFEPFRDPERVPLARDQRVRVPMEVEAAHCYTAAGFAASGVDKLGLRILDEVGSVLARSEAAARTPTVQFCADRQGEYAVELHAASGHGKARLVLFAGPAREVGKARGLWLGRRAGEERSRAPLERVVSAMLKQARHEGYDKAQALAKDTLARAEAVTHAVELPAGRCALVAAAGGRGTSQLALRIRTAAGEPIAEQRSGTGRVTARVCVDREVRAVVELIARGGSGGYALHMLTKEAPEWLPDTSTPWPRGMLLDAVERGRRHGWKRRGDIRAVNLPERRSASPASGACSRWHVVGAGRTGKVQVELRRGGRIAATDAGRNAKVVSCDGRGPTPTLEAKGRGSTSKAFMLQLEHPTGE